MVVGVVGVVEVVWIAAVLAGTLGTAPAQPLPISGANLADDCQFPQVVSFRAGGELCSGSLVHPQVVVTAAHCIRETSPVNIHMGELHNPEAHIVEVERCEAHPDSVGNELPAHDVAYCVLARPVEGPPRVPLLAGCEVDAVVEGEVAVIVGYGIPEDGATFGRKRYAYTTIASGIRGDGTVLVGDGGANGCKGDSGGPALVQLADGTWRVIGVLSWSPGCQVGADTYRALADRIGWLEERSGFDLSPCRDDDGHWSPSAECDGFEEDPRVSEQGWGEFCAGSGVAPAPTCVEAAVDSSSSSEGGSSSASAGGSSSGDAPDEVGTTTGCGCGQRGGAGFVALGLALGGGVRRRRRALGDGGRSTRLGRDDGSGAAAQADAGRGVVRRHDLRG